jgi:hypothetical protein
MRLSYGTTSAAAALALALTIARTTGAQPASADPLFDEGRLLLDQGRWAEACDKFKGSYERKQTAGKAFNLSVCEEKQGHLVKAAQWMSDGLSLLEPNDARLAGGAARRDELEHRLGRLIVTLPQSAPAGIEVSVDGVRIEVGKRTPVDPGKRVITTRAPGRTEGRTEAEVAEAASLQVEAPIGPPAAITPMPLPERPPSKPPPAKPLAPTRDGASQRIAGAAVTGLGLASLVGFGVTAGLVSSKHTAFESASSPTERESLASEGRKLEIAEAVLLGLGIAASATGVVVIATAPRRSTTASFRARPSFAVAPREASLGVRGEF